MPYDCLICDTAVGFGGVAWKRRRSRLSGFSAIAFTNCRSRESERQRVRERVCVCVVRARVCVRVCVVRARQR